MSRTLAHPRVVLAATADIAHARRLLAELYSAADADAVHGVRVTTKRLRAYWRLYRPVADEVSRAANDSLRDAAKGLATSRDAVVMHATMQRLMKRGSDELAAALEPLADRLSAVNPADLQAIETTTLDLADRVFRDDATRWARLDAVTDADLVQAGLGKLYRRGRKRWKALENKADSMALHTWRKDVKRLNYALAVVVGEDVAGPLKKLLKRAKTLGKRLGRHHDLHVLEVRLRALKDVPDAAARDAVLAEIAVRQRRLETKIRRLAKPVYRRGVGKFTGRVLKAISP